MAIKRGWILMEQENARYVWNETKRRHEFWIKTAGGAWVLVGGNPTDVISDNFISPSITPWVALFGISSQMHWWVTGRPNPTGANFVQVNELGGGIEVRTRPVANRWVALHSGNIYPFSMSESPHIYLRGNLGDISNIHMHVGLVGATNKPATGSAHSQPDDGIWLEYDDSVDGNFRSVTRSGGVETSKILDAADTGHHSICIRVNDAGDEVEFLFDGDILQTHTSGENLPTGIQLQTYFEVMTRENVRKHIHVHHYIQLFDALWV